jgi:hypothetical protein
MGEFDEILHWKLRRQYNRQLKNIKLNTGNQIIKITKSAFSIQYNDKDFETEQHLKVLIKLHGVQVPVASAILTLCYPKEYCVIDRRGWRQIFDNDKKKTYYTVKEYIKYMTIIKRTALEFGVTPQEIDMAIWQNDIENYGKESFKFKNSEKFKT